MTRTAVESHNREDRITTLVFSNYNRVSMRHDHTVLSDFPKQRPTLPEAYRNIYAEHYKRNREGTSTASSLSQMMESWMHRKVAADVAGKAKAPSTLEIGAGGLNHLKYEPPCESYDVVEGLTELIANSPFRSRVARAYADLGEIQDARYDRIISIA